MLTNNERFLQIHRLFRECIEALNISMLPDVESDRLGDEFEKTFPITEWGKIDWDKIDHKINIGYNPKNIIPALEKLLGKSVDTSVYILWSSASYPIIKTDLNDIAQHFDDVTCVSFEKFIFNLELRYILEILPSDQMTIGVVSECLEQYNK